MPSHEPQQERAERLNEVFESLLRGRQEERAEQQQGGEVWLEDRIADLPERAQGEIRAYERKLAEAGVANPAKRSELIEEKIGAFEQTYQDRRFTVGDGEHMLNKGYAKEHAVASLREILGDSPTPDDLKKVALLNFDANGLKAVNDLSASHEKGTEYLKRIADVYYAKDSPEANALKEMGIDELLPVTSGGDEYSILMTSKKPIPPETIEKALRLYEEAVAKLDVSDLVDFTDEKTLLRYAGVTGKPLELTKEDELRRTLEEIRKEIPQGFKMRATAPGGGATLYEGLLKALEHKTKPLTSTDAFSRAVDKIVGGMWDAADDPAEENKKSMKGGLHESASAEDRFYGKVILRTSEARVLEAKLEEMAMELKKNETMESELAALDDLMDQGVMDEVAYGKNMREIRKRYRTAA